MAVHDPDVAPVSMSRPKMRYFANFLMMISDFDVMLTLLSCISYFLLGLWWVIVILMMFGGIYCLGAKMAVEYARKKRNMRFHEYVNQRQATRKKREKGKIRNFEAEEDARNGHPRPEDAPFFANTNEVERFIGTSRSNISHWPDPEAIAEFLQGQELVKQWKEDFDNDKNSNPMDYKHSIPLYRLANFGWQGDLDPMDLAGLLNANTLYSFTVGCPQLFFTYYSISSAPTNDDAQVSLLYISAAVGFISLVLSLYNIGADVTKRLHELMRKEKSLQETQDQAEVKTEDMEKEFLLLEKLDEERKAKVEVLLRSKEGLTPMKEVAFKITKLIEDYENRKKRIRQTIEAINRTDAATDFFPEEPLYGQVGTSVTVTHLTVVAWLLSFLLMNANVGMHGYLMVHAFLHGTGKPQYFIAGIVMFFLVGLVKWTLAVMFTFGAFAKKPTFMALMENLSILLPLATSLVYISLGDFEAPLILEIAGIGIAVVEVIVNTYMESVPPRAIHALTSCFKRGSVKMQVPPEGNEV